MEREARRWPRPGLYWANARAIHTGVHQSSTSMSTGRKGCRWTLRPRQLHIANHRPLTQTDGSKTCGPSPNPFHEASDFSPNTRAHAY
eukprot:8051009-Lingulodinium_polyedra.AAC.1